MKTDWDDAPEYLRNRKKPGPWRFLAILGIGSGIFWALVAMFAKPIVLDINQIKSGIYVGGKPWFDQEPVQPTRPFSPPSVVSYESPEPSTETQAKGQRPLSQAEIDWFEGASARATERIQSSFSNDNYTPKQAANSYSPPVTRQIAAAPVASERKSRTVRRERTSRWIKSWNGGTNYLAEWVTVSNHIDGTSVCENHRRGSIDYRECRKAAKQHFHEECRTWRARFDSDRKDHSELMKNRYCGAASSFNPMG